MLQGEKEGNKNVTLTKSQDEFENLAEDFYNNIIWRKLHALLTKEPIKSSPETVAQIFEISIEEAVDAIEGLYDLGLLFKNGDFYTAGKQQFLIPENLNTREKRIDTHINQSRQILSQVDTNLDIGAWTHYIAASKEDMHWFRSKFKEIVQELEDRALKSKGKEIYSFTYTDVPTRVNNKGDQG